MRATLIRLSLATAALGVTSAARAQDAPSGEEPNIRLEDPAAPDEDRDKVRLTDDVTPDAPGDSETPPSELDFAEENPSSPIPPSIKKMSEEEKLKLSGLLRDASTYLGGIRVQEAFEKLVEAEAMAPDYSVVHNLLGAAYTKTRDFDKAAVSFSKAVELDPRAFMSRFNLTEILFVQGDFAEAEKEFKELIAANKEMNESTSALIEFKILICRLKQDDEEGARAILNTYDFLDDQPVYYFGNAAIHFNKGEEDEARSWIASANRVYPPAQNGLYADSFIEIGWIENFQ